MSHGPTADLYEGDFYAWTQAQAKELRRFARARTCPSTSRTIDRRLSGALRRDLRRPLPHLYEEARMDLPKKLPPYGKAGIADRFRERCPYALDQVPGDFWPEAAGFGNRH